VRFHLRISRAKTHPKISHWAKS